MKGSMTSQPDRANLFVVVPRNLKQRLEEAARNEGLTRRAWVLKAIEAKLAVQDAGPSLSEDASPEYLQEQKLDDMRTLRETW